MHEFIGVAPAAKEAECLHGAEPAKSPDLENRRLAAQLERLKRVSAQAEQQSRQI